MVFTLIAFNIKGGWVIIQRRNGKHAKKHVVRNTILIVVLVLLVGGAAFGMSRYRAIKDSVNSSFKASGLTKERNVAKLLQNKKPVSVLLLGTDTGDFGRNYKGRTDSMMVATLNAQKNKVTITSIPRDTAVKIPGFEGRAPSKINAAYSWGSAKTSIITVQKMLNIPIDFYALINLNGLKRVVNQVGGIDVTPTLTFSNLGYSFTKGVKVHMNGKKALAYADMRYKDPQGDYGRQTRQREILMAVIKKSGAISSLLNQDFVDSISAETQTDLTFDDLTEIAKNYRGAIKNVRQTHLQGTGENLNGQSMEVMKQKELQRVTNFVRSGLSLAYKKTGNIAVFNDNYSAESNSSESSATTSRVTSSSSVVGNSY